MTEERFVSTRRRLRDAPTPVLEGTQQLYRSVGRVSFLAVGACLLLGVWVNWRWLPTSLVPLLSWGIAHQVDDLITTELERRRTEADACPDRLG